MRLLERETYLSTLAGYADEAQNGHGRMVLVAGEAGVGKSSLVEGLRQLAASARWFCGSCDGLFTPRPLAPLFDIADQMGGELPLLCRADSSRELLFAALLRCLVETDQLTVLVVEDVHWADEATLDVLRFLGRRIRGARTMLVVTYRDDGLAPDVPLRITLGDLSTQRTTRRMALPPLSETAVGVLAAEAGVEAAGLYALTGGNPFFVTEVVQVGGRDLPPSIRDAVLARVAGLGPSARHVLDVASLIGSRVSSGLLQDVCGPSPAVIDDLLACGVVSGDGWGLRFRHEIARIAVQSAVAPHRARVGHAAILDALVASGCEDDARLAFHAESSGNAVQALKYATNAGRQASSLGAHREAAVQFERALKWASQAEPRALAVLYDDLSRELGLLDRWQESADAHEQALGLWRHLGDPLREGDALRRLSRIMWHMCRGEEAERAALDSVRILERGGPSPELAWACANLAHQRAISGDNQEAFELARRARAMAERFDLSHVVCETLNTEGWIAPALGRDWVAPLHQALEVAIDAGLAVEAATAFCSLYDLNQSSLRFPEADHVFNDAIAYCESRDLTTFAIHLLGERTIHLEKVGRWDESVRLASSLLDRRGPTPLLRLNPLVSLGVVQARRREPDAWRSLNEALILAQDVRDVYGVVEARIGLAEAHWLEQSTEAATLELDEADRSLCDDPMCRAWLAVWRHRITGCNVMADLPEPFASEVAGHHLRAAELWDELGVGYHAGVALMGTDDEGPLREAVRRFDVLGAKATAWLTRVKMRRLGITAIPTGARPSTREHPAGLTMREHEVLELVSAGLTNDEISRRLVVSVKTVDHHVSAILGKLGVGNRKAAAREASRLALVGAQDGELDTRSG